MPTSNPIEAYNKQVKQNRMAVLRASTQYLFNYGLPNLVFLDTQFLGDKDFTYVQKSPTFPSRVFATNQMVNADYFHCSSYDGLMEYTYFNVGWWF